MSAIDPNGALNWKVARVFHPLLPPHRYKGAKGGRASAKSHFFGEDVVIHAARYPGIRICCLRQTQKSIKRSSKLLIEDKIEKFKIPGFTPRNEMIQTPGKGMIIFQGMQDHTAESIKSLEGFDIFYFEEANKMTEGSLRILRPTARSTERTKLKYPELWFGWNPNDPKDPVDAFFADNPPDSVCVHSTFRDNPFLPKELIAEIEWDRQRNYEKYVHVWEGGYALRSESRVFNNWKVEEFELGEDGLPADPVFYWGSDWGFSVDPTVLIGCFIVGHVLYVRFEAWKVGCEIDDTPALFDRVDPDYLKATGSGRARNWTITADSSRADTISYMRRNGYPKISGARKGAGSIEDGIEFLKNYDIIVHPDCVHVADELQHYSYKIDKLTEQVLPILEDKKNHTIDALRYAVEDIRWQVEGGVESRPSEVASKYDGAMPIIIETIVPEDVGQHQVAVEAFDTLNYDGSLT